MNLTRMNTKKLINEVKGLHDSIFNLDCFGSRDVLTYEGICRELKKRGYEIINQNGLWLRRGGSCVK